MGLMAGRARLGVHLLTVLLQLSHRVRSCCGGSVRIAGGVHGGVLRVDPRVVVAFRHGVYHHWHEAVILAAQLSALSAVDTWSVHFEPRISYESGDAVLFHAE